MTNETVKLILSLSFSGSILAALIFALKPFIKHKLSKSLQYYIWIVVLLRLIIPFSFENSIMNGVFQSSKNPIEISTERTFKPLDSASENIINSSKLTSVAENPVIEVNDANGSQSIYFRDIFNQYAIYIWFIGVIIALAVNLIGYIKFLKYIKQGNISATQEENEMLFTLLRREKHVTLLRNSFVTTPMLIGILRPCIIIPHVDFNEKQLKNILLHEISHLKRFDIVVKWVTMIAASIHWFNPFMYFIKKEINHACELACDEAVIKNLNAAEKQAYGDTLISVVAEHKYTAQELQATMCEEKKSLKERLIAIMSYSKKSKIIMVLSVLILLSVIIGAIVLGTSVGTKNITPPKIYIGGEYVESKVALTGGYSWENRGVHIIADSDHPKNFQYKTENVVDVTAKQQLIISVENLKSDKKYDYTMDEFAVYKEGELIEFEFEKPSFMNGNLYLQAPPEAGEYIYFLSVKFKDKGTVSYGFVIRVDMMSYDLTEISKYKTPYVGDASKIGSIVRNLPIPSSYFVQQYISMETSKKPYGLTIYYEAASSEGKDEVMWTSDTLKSVLRANNKLNALVLFSMIDNLDEVSFTFRNSQSEGKLDESKYKGRYTFDRESIESEYGDSAVLGNNLNSLQGVLTSKIEISAQERQRMELYMEVMRDAFRRKYGGEKFVSVKLDTLVGLSDRAKEEVMSRLTSLAPMVFNFDTVKNDKTKFEFDGAGKLISAIDGNILWVEIEEYSESKAIITGVSWSGNLGAVFAKYEATFENGVWQLK